EEGEEDEAEHIERGQQRRKQAKRVERVAARDLERGEQDGILTEESREWRNAGDREGGDEHGREGVFDLASQTTHVAHVLLAAHGMNDGTSGKEEQRLEKGMRHQMEDAGREGADAAGKEHIAELADRGIREYTLNIGLHQAYGGSKERCGAPDNGDNDHR